MYAIRSYYVKKRQKKLSPGYRYVKKILAKTRGRPRGRMREIMPNKIPVKKGIVGLKDVSRLYINIQRKNVNTKTNNVSVMIRHGNIKNAG